MALAGSSQVLEALQLAYAKAVDNTLVLSVSAACIALPFALSMEFLNVKKIAQQRENEGQGLPDNDHMKSEVSP